MLNFIIACDKPWHIEVFIENRHKLHGNWSIVTCTSDLVEQASKLDPRFIFFPHWSEMVPSEIFENHECVCFHMTDVPFGRGGSPLQNLIIRGYSKTVVTALKMIKEVDAGPIYLKRGLDLTGSALDIFKRSARICFEMICDICTGEISPVDQVGDPTFFKRRNPAQSEIPETVSIYKLYDIIRMLDAPNYPKAFISLGEIKIEFFNASISEDGMLSAEVKVMNHER